MLSRVRHLRGKLGPRHCDVFGRCLDLQNIVRFWALGCVFWRYLDSYFYEPSLSVSPVRLCVLRCILMFSFFLELVNWCEAGAHGISCECVFLCVCVRA